MASTKIEFNYNKITRIQGLDEFGASLFPRNRNHQKVFLAIFIELKYSSNQFVPFLRPLCDKYGFSPRNVRDCPFKNAASGLIDHVSRFNKAYGCREGWVLSSRFTRALSRLSELVQGFRVRKDSLQESKDRDLFRYL